MIKNLKLSELELNSGQLEGLPKNPRFIRDERFEKLKKSIEEAPEMLALRELLVYPLDSGKFIVIGGNMRLRACKDLGYKELPCKIITKETPIEKLREYTIKDNVAFGQEDWDVLANDWDAEELDDWGLDVWQDNDDESGDWSGENSKPANDSLTDRFVVPPFSILDTRKGYWQARKKVWRELIGDMGESRQGTLTGIEMRYPELYTKTRQHREELGIGFKEYLDDYVSDEVKEREASKVLTQGVSLFDPVLSELMCRWFMPEKGGKIFDCFAGDTQKGLVFGQCGYDFTGIELRQEQVDINNRVIAGRDLPIRYICDDGQNVANHFEPNSQDMLFSCPPYYDLEVYSDDAKDASNQGTYEGFIEILTNAFRAALGCLKDDRFAVVVVGNVRDKKTGFYHNFIPDVKRIFADNGCPLYNELILVENIGSNALRAARNMDSRKVAKTHQNVLVFYKGNPKNISKIFGKIEFTEEDLQLFDAAAKVEEINE